MPNENPNIANSLLNSFKAFVGSHFLLNVINAIQSDVILKENKSAFDTIQRFNRVYKLALRLSNDQFASIEDEVAFVQVYAALEQMRFPQNKFPQINIASIDDETTVPSFIFQSLIENAWLLHLESNKKPFKIAMSSQDNTTNLTIDLVSSFTVHSKVQLKVKLALDRLTLLQNEGLITYDLVWNQKSFLNLTLKTHK
ncbi:MAG: LytS/YehU family sensor histidine kinase [bacterium]|jgi:LytS/YehU family sensor histidine kinase